jgi:hypothetical protein
MFPAMPDTEANPDLPGPFQEISKGAPIPPVDAEDLKRMWGLYREAGMRGAGAMSFRVLEEVCSPGANVGAVWSRHSMLSMVLLCSEFLAPWQNGEELNDVVFRVAATFPMEGMKRGVVYSEWPFDLDAFLDRLREENRH